MSGLILAFGIYFIALAASGSEYGFLLALVGSALVGTYSAMAEWKARR